MRHPILRATLPAFLACSFLASAAWAQLAQPPAEVTEGILKDQSNTCPANARLGNPDASPLWSGWGNAANNARFQTKAGAGLTAATYPNSS